MASFDDILANLHDNAKLTDKDDVIEITSARKFVIPSNFDMTLAYVGDVNSQVVRFDIPSTHEGHELGACTYKKLRWRAMANGTEGTSDLIKSATQTAAKGVIYEWEFPPEVARQAGTLEIAISFYDINEEDGHIAFAWNTPVYNGFKIGDTLANVGLEWNENTLPAADEILTINRETRMIVAPKGYNMTIANYGDRGITNVYFQVDKFIGGMDITQSNIKINAKFNDYVAQGIEDVNARPLTT
jgi:hypothetical protein